MLKFKLMLINALEVLCIEHLCCIFWPEKKKKKKKYVPAAMLLAHPVLCRPTHLNISGFAPGIKGH